MSRLKRHQHDGVTMVEEMEPEMALAANNEVGFGPQIGTGRAFGNGWL